MRGWWRFRRRNPELDDLIAAYVEGRADAAGEARLRQQLAGDPARQADADSLRATVALLRTVASAEAPRSFALVESPAPVRRPFIRYEWAPAMASAAAAVIVGLLVLGDVTGTLRQAGAPSLQAQPVSTQVAEAPLMFAAEAGAPAAGVPEVTVVTEAEVVQPEAAAEPPPLMKAVEAAPAEEALAVPAPAQEAGLDAIEKAEAAPPQALRGAAPEEGEIEVQEAAEAPIPRPTPPPGARAPSEAAAGGPAAEPAEEEQGFSLPVRQLEIGLGAAAAALAAGAWLLLRRRSRQS